MYDNGDILLFALSASCQPSWPEFKRCFDEIHRKVSDSGQGQPGESATVHRWQALHLLSCLGHLDTHYNPSGIRVVIAPPALAALPGRQTARAILCGARAPNTIPKLAQAADAIGVEIIVSSQSDASPYAPTRVELQAGNSLAIEEAAEVAGLRYLDTPPSRLLAHVSVSLREYRESLAWTIGPELDWRCEDFDVESLRFLPARETRAQRRLSRYQNPATTIWRYQLWQDGRSAEVNQDWGRYAILSLASQAILKYEPGTRAVLVPYGAPLPVLQARALGLCSGHCPGVADLVQSGGSRRHYAFASVPPSLFNKIAGKVGQPTVRMASHGHRRRV